MLFVNFNNMLLIFGNILRISGPLGQTSLGDVGRLPLAGQGHKKLTSLGGKARIMLFFAHMGPYRAHMGPYRPLLARFPYYPQ